MPEAGSTVALVGAGLLASEATGLTDVTPIGSAAGRGPSGGGGSVAPTLPPGLGIPPELFASLFGEGGIPGLIQAQNQQLGLVTDTIGSVTATNQQLAETLAQQSDETLSTFEAYQQGLVPDRYNPLTGGGIVNFGSGGSVTDQVTEEVSERIPTSREAGEGTANTILDFSAGLYGGAFQWGQENAPWERGELREPIDRFVGSGPPIGGGGLQEDGATFEAPFGIEAGGGSGLVEAYQNRVSGNIETIEETATPAGARSAVVSAVNTYAGNTGGGGGSIGDVGNEPKQTASGGGGSRQASQQQRSVLSQATPGGPGIDSARESRSTADPNEPDRQEREKEERRTAGNFRLVR